MRSEGVSEWWHRVLRNWTQLHIPRHAQHQAAGSGRWTSRPKLMLAAGVGLLAIAGGASALAIPGSSRNAPAVASQPVQPAYLEPIGTLVLDGVVPPPALSGDTGHVGVPAGLKPGRRSGTGTASGIAGYQGMPGTLTPAALATLALEQGCSTDAAAIAAAIAMAESGGSPSAQGDIGLMDSVWDWSAGLWQIRGLRSERGTGALRDSIANQAVAKNATAMYSISGACSDWTPWSTYNSGAYLQFMQLAKQAVAFVTAYYQSHDHRYPPVPAPDPSAVIPAGYGGGSAGGSSAQTTTSPTAAKTAGKGAGGGSSTGSAGTAGQPPASSATTGSAPGQPAGQPQPSPVRTPSGGLLPTLPGLPLPTVPTLPLKSVVKSLLPSLPKL